MYISKEALRPSPLDMRTGLKSIWESVFFKVRRGYKTIYYKTETHGEKQ